MPAEIPVTAIVLTHNEAANIGECLTRMERAQDVVLVDSGSTDDTVEAARSVRPDVRIFHHPFTDFGTQRNWALDHTDPRQPWILFVDADEFCEPALMEEIEAFIAAPGRFAGAFIAGRNYFLGRWLKHSTMYPSYQLRLLKRGSVRYRKEGHGQREVTDGPLHYLRASWRHEAFGKGIEQWIERHNHYSSEEADHLLALRTEPLRWRDLARRDPLPRRRALKTLAARLPFRPLFRFVYVYLFRRGFLDGYPGFVYAMLLSSHQIHIWAKIVERRHS